MGMIEGNNQNIYITISLIYSMYHVNGPLESPGQKKILIVVEKNMVYLLIVT